MSILLHRNMTSSTSCKSCHADPCPVRFCSHFLNDPIINIHVSNSDTVLCLQHYHFRHTPKHQQRHNAAYHMNNTTISPSTQQPSIIHQIHPRPPYRLPTLGSITLPLASPFALPYPPPLALSCTRLISLTSPKFAAGSSARPCLSTSSAVMPGTCSRMP
jgi:hypothetical protein